MAVSRRGTLYTHYPSITDYTSKVTNIAMKSFVVFAMLVCVACALPRPDASIPNLRVLPAIKHEELHDEFGQYAIRYATAEGTIVSEQGRLVPTADGKDRVLIKKGEYIFVGPDNKVYRTYYTSDLNGHNVVGDHLPVA